MDVGMGRKATETMGTIICGTRELDERPFPDSIGSAFLDFRDLSQKLGTSEQWVRRNVRSTYTRDPIPHLRFGRTIRFDWNSPALQAWLERRKTGTEETKWTPAPDRSSEYTASRTGFEPNRKEKN
jgi:hypothetical protein